MKPTIKPGQSITVHKDRTVSLWDSIQQQWRRLPAYQVSSAVLATLSQDERDRIGRAAGEYELSYYGGAHDRHNRPIRYRSRHGSLEAARAEHARIADRLAGCHSGIIYGPDCGDIGIPA